MEFPWRSTKYDSRTESLGVDEVNFAFYQLNSMSNMNSFSHLEALYFSNQAQASRHLSLIRNLKR